MLTPKVRQPKKQMIPLETMTTFFAAAILLALAPGPDNLFVLTQSALYGPIAGIVVTLGLCTGLVFHTLAVALGVAAVLEASAIAFSLLKFLGAGYLLFLAWQAFRAKVVRIPSDSADQPSRGKLYLRGVLMNVTNPKVTIFFLALLPQFADSARGNISLQLLLLGGFFILATILVFGSVALLAGALNKWFSRSANIQLGLNRLAGIVFISLALKLAASER